MNFSNILLDWYSIYKRDLPWRDTNNPYFIWLSEIILQQTRVEQGLPYYLKFVKTFPTVSDLANAPEDKVLKLWQGLGYYSRARNLHVSAKVILNSYNGIFPEIYSDILNLKGVGPYTAAAISSFSFNLPYAVVDGNVVRVLSRVFGVQESFDTPSGRNKFQKLAQNLLDKKKAGENNQAIMEFGAIQCTYLSPKCNSCPFISCCVAYSTNSISRLPVRAKKNKVKKRFFNYLVIKNNNMLLLGKKSTGIWKGLYDFPFIEDSNKKSQSAIIESKKWAAIFKNRKYKIESVSSEIIHKLSHQHIYARFWIIQIKNFGLEKYSFIRITKLNSYPVSRLADKFLKQYNII